MKGVLTAGGTASCQSPSFPLCEIDHVILRINTRRARHPFHSKVASHASTKCCCCCFLMPSPLRARSSLPELGKENVPPLVRKSPRKQDGLKRKKAKSFGGGASGGTVGGVSPRSKERAAPRKSAIRATPQVFQSPTNLEPNPEHEHIRMPGQDMQNVVAKTEQDGLNDLLDERLRSPGLPNPFTALFRPSSASPAKNEAHTISVPAKQPMEADRKRRRVTFSAYQEQTYVRSYM